MFFNFSYFIKSFKLKTKKTNKQKKCAQYNNKNYKDKDRVQ